MYKVSMVRRSEFGNIQPEPVWPVVSPETVSPATTLPAERGSDRFIGQVIAVMLSFSSIAMGGPAGEKIGNGLARIIAQESSELVVRAWGNLGAGVGIVAGFVGSGVLLYKFFRR